MGRQASATFEIHWLRYSSTINWDECSRREIPATRAANERQSGPGEFQEIAHCGGKIEVTFDSNDNSVSMQWSGSGPLPASLYQLGVALDGSTVEYWPIAGIDMRPAPDPVPFVSVLLGSDVELMWGRSCPKCSSYFRTNRPIAYRPMPVLRASGHQLRVLHKESEGLHRAGQASLDPGA